MRYRLALRWHKWRKNCRVGDMGPYTDGTKKHARCRVCGTVWPVPSVPE